MDNTITFKSVKWCQHKYDTLHNKWLYVITQISWHQEKDNFRHAQLGN